MSACLYHVIKSYLFIHSFIQQRESENHKNLILRKLWLEDVFCDNWLIIIYLTYSIYACMYVWIYWDVCRHMGRRDACDIRNNV